MALRGNLRDFSLPDVFQLVTLSGKTGVLRIRREEAEGSVWFRDGAVFFAQSDWHRELLGQRLVTAGKITPSALSKALEIQRAEPADGRRLGQILVDEGYVTEGVLEAFVQEQIQDTIFDLFRWDEGDFDFESVEEAPEEDIGLAVSIENVVMEGSRRLEEWTRIKKKIPSMGIVFKMATAPGEGTFDISLKPTEWSLLLKVDGTRSVAELAHDMERTDFEVARIIYGLFSAGLLEVASDEEVERLRAEREKLEASIAAARPAAPSPTQAAPAASAVTPAPAPAGGEHVVEEPAFLSGAQAASSEDMGALQEMMGAVLGAPLTQAAPAPEPEVVAAPEPEVVAAPEPEAPPALAGGASGAEAATEVAPADIEALLAGSATEAPVAPVETQETPRPEPQAAPAAAPPAAGVYVFEDEAPATAVSAAPVEEAVAPLAQEPGPVLAQEPEAAPGLDAGLALDPGATGAADLEGLLETLEIAAGHEDLLDDGYMPAVAEPASVAMPAAASPEPSTADFASDLMALGLGELPEQAVAAVPEEGEPTIAEIEAAAAAAESGEATIAEIEAAARATATASGAAGTPAPAAAEEAADLSELLSSLGAPDQTGVLDTSAALITEDEADAVTGGDAPAAGVISTDAFLSDFGSADVSFSSGLGDEITALTGGGGGGSSRQRPAASAAKIPEGAAGGQVLHRDSHVDRDLLLKIIDGVKHL